MNNEQTLTSTVPSCSSSSSTLVGPVMQTYLMENEGMEHMQDTVKQYIKMKLHIFTTLSVSNGSRSSGKCKAKARVYMYHLVTLCRYKVDICR